jgi:uncharacterized protein
MKIQIPAVIAAFILSATWAKAQSAQQPPQINVSGSAEVKVTPDEIRFNAGVEILSISLEEATQQTDERIASALQFLKSAGIKEKDVQTDFLSVDPQYDQKVSRTAPVNYVVRKGITVRVTDVTKSDMILTGLLAHGVNHIHGIEFRTSELRKHRDAARAMAIRAAKEKADALAREIGVKRGKARNINAAEYGGWLNWSGGSWWGQSSRGGLQNVSQISTSAAGEAEAGEGTMALGQISVTATITVSFLIE